MSASNTTVPANVEEKSSAKKEAIPYRQIRAVFDDETITVYQAYSEAIATAAVQTQLLCASKQFSFDRYTWIKPSWCWMMYRSGYALKDSRQTRILALKITHASMRKLLLSAAVCRGKIPFTSEEKMNPVRVQWDPERSPRIGMLPYRSIQIGIGRALIKEFAHEMIVSIEDVTDRAAKMREVLGKDPVDDEDLNSMEKGEQKEEAMKKDFTVDDLIELGVMPREEVYPVDEELKAHLKMGGRADSESL